MAGPSPESTRNLSPLENDHRIGGVADFNLDGFPDILVRDINTGEVQVHEIWWFQVNPMDGVKSLGKVPNQDLQVVGPR